MYSMLNIYLNPLSPHFRHAGTFKLSWPLVYWQLLISKTRATRFWNFLSAEMRTGSIRVCNVETFFENIDLATKPLFCDMSKMIESFDEFKTTWKLKIIENVDREYFPCITCPVGCEEFIDEYKTIDFVHYLGFSRPSINSFPNQTSTYEACDQTTDSTMHTFPTTYSPPWKHPSLLVNDNEVFLLTCRDHGVKINNKQYIYLPEHHEGGFSVHLLMVLLQLS